MRRALSWVLFAGFVAAAILTHTGEPVFLSEGRYAIGKPIVWCCFILFVGYSYYCSTRENIFRTIRSLWAFHWGRQIGIDLYLGLVISSFIIYLNEGSLLVLGLWLIPILLFANLATLLYFALNYDSIVKLFTWS